MDVLLKPSQMTTVDQHDIVKPLRTSETDLLEISVAEIDSSSKLTTNEDLDIASPDDVCKALSSRLSIETLFKVLRWLQKTETDFRWKVPSPKAARITNLLVNHALPDYWVHMQGAEALIYKKSRKLLLSYLASLTGINALVTRLQSLMMQRKNEQQQGDAKVKVRMAATEVLKALEDVINVLQSILAKEGMVLQLWDDFEATDIKPMQRGLLQKELVSLLAGSRLLSVSAEAFATINELSREASSPVWIGNGQQYAMWLATNVKTLVLTRKGSSHERLHLISALFSRVMSLGYTDQVVKGVFWDTTSVDTEGFAVLQAFLGTLHFEMQRTVLYSLIHIISEESSVRSRTGSTSEMGAQTTSAIAAFLSAFVQENPRLCGFLAEWVTDRSSGIAEVNEYSRRAVILVLSQDKESVQALVRSLLTLFGDSFYIKHTSIFNQEVLTKSLLLLIGYASRTNLTFLKSIAQSGQYINAISTRIAASSPRAKFLGMVVGNAITSIVSPEEKKLIFGGNELNGEDGQRYFEMVKLKDSVCSIQDMQSFFRPQKARENVSITLAKQAKEVKKSGPTSRIIAIEEINSSTESEDDDLPVYAKPDSDQEDEDSDPELVQRNKATAPVYIRDLIKGFRDTENYDRHKLALTTASSLIRRKANFGTEVKEHLEELATQLTGLGDKYSMDGFPKLRLQAMIATFIAQPLEMGQWYSRTYFNGDYSIAQRASILTAMTMGARELAGFKKEDGDLTGANALPESPLPTKRLPDKMHKLWTVEAAPVNSLTQTLQKRMIKPMAAEAVDQVAGPKILQVRTFSSRMEVEKRRKKPIANELAKIVAEGMFFPLTARWQNNLQAYGNRSAHTSPFLLSHFLKTLALLLHASGPSTLSLPQMTREFWVLLLSLRTVATEDVLILEALLFSFMTLFDVNEDKRRIAEDFSGELLETQAWVQKAFDGMRGGSVEGERIRMLAAGILVGAGEVVKKYEKLLMGDLINYT